MILCGALRKILFAKEILHGTAGIFSMGGRNLDY